MFLLPSHFKACILCLMCVEKSAMTEGQLYAYERFMLSIVDERVIREGFYKEGMQKEKIEIARNLKSMSLTLEDISKATGLSTGEISRL